MAERSLGRVPLCSPAACTSPVPSRALAPGRRGLAPGSLAHRRHQLSGGWERAAPRGRHTSCPREHGGFFNSSSTYEKFSPFADTFKKRVSKNTFFVLVRVVDELW